MSRGEKVSTLFSTKKEDVRSRFLGDIDEGEGIELNCEKELFYIFMLVDMFHDYFDDTSTNKRGTIVHKLISFFETLSL